MWILFAALAAIAIRLVDHRLRERRQLAFERAWLRLVSERAAFWRSRLMAEDALSAGDAAAAQEMRARCETHLVRAKELSAGLLSRYPGFSRRGMVPHGYADGELGAMIDALVSARLDARDLESAQERASLGAAYRQLEAFREHPPERLTVGLYAGLGGVLGLALGFVAFVMEFRDSYVHWLGPLVGCLGAGALLGTLVGGLWSQRLDELFAGLGRSS